VFSESVKRGLDVLLLLVEFSAATATSATANPKTTVKLKNSKGSNILRRFNG